LTINFSRSRTGVLSGVMPSGVILRGYLPRRRNPVANRFVAAIFATLAVLIISTLGTTQWVSADGGTTGGTTVPDPPPPPSTLDAPRHVIAKAGDASAAVAWNRPAGEDLVIDGYVVTADPSGITVETVHPDTLVIVEGLTNGTEYTFTVVAFNGDGFGEVSESSNAVTPKEKLRLDEDKLERLREHLRKQAREAKERLHKAQERAREQLEKQQDRIDDWLHKQNDRANKHLDKVTDKANRQEAKQVEKANDWFEKLKQQLRKKVQRAEGTDRYDDMVERAEEQVDKAKDKLDDRLEKSAERTEKRIDKAEETVEKRLQKAEEHAERKIEQTEERFTKKITKLEERLQDLLERLRKLWLKRSAG
jgi:hypothetical protein